MNDAPALIIGSGIGGLTLAARLARAGEKVVVFEQHRRHGGYATTFVRKRKEIEVSLHMMGDLEEGCRLRGLLEELGVWQKVEFVRSKSLYKASFPGCELEVPTDGYGAYLEQLERLFPRDAQALRAFFERMRAIRREIDAISRAGAANGLADFARVAPRLVEALESTLADVFDQYGFGEAVRALLSALWLYHGLPPSRLSVVQFASVWSEYHGHGGWYPRGHSQAISDALKKIIEDAGGEVRTRARVQRVRVERGRTVGVELENGQYVDASVVVANTDPYQAFLGLIGEEHLPPRFVKRLGELEPSCSALQAFVLIDCDMASTFGEDAHEVIVHSGHDIEEAYQQSLCGDVARAPYILTVFDNVLGPGQAVAAQGTMSMFLLASNETWANLTREEYKAQKARVQEVLLGRLEERYPGLRNHVTYCEVSTPSTNVRYTSNAQGAIYGLAPTVRQTMFRRLSHKTPVEGFWMVGAWTQPSGGYSGSIWSGYMLAERLLAARASRRSQLGAGNAGASRTVVVETAVMETVVTEEML